MYASFLESLANIGFRSQLEKMGAIPKGPKSNPPALPPDPVFEALAVRHVCPDCGGDKFNMGPSGGMSQNIKCSNMECGSEFCVAPFEDGQFYGEPFFAKRTNRSEEDSISLWGRGYGKLHLRNDFKDNETRDKVTAL